jgi:hypothetical protein
MVITVKQKGKPDFKKETLLIVMSNPTRTGPKILPSQNKANGQISSSPGAIS